MAHIGVAGFMGAGKSAVARILQQSLSCKHIDADKEAKRLMNENAALQNKLADAFGEDILCEKTVNFPQLGKRAFSSITRLNQLNSIVHPVLIDYLGRRIKEENDHRIIFDAALIPLWKIEDWFSTCIWVHADRQVRCKRLDSISRLDPDSIKKRMRLQEMLFSPPAGKQWSVIENNADHDTLRSEVTELVSRICTFA
ncbi:MAG: dephospho-CoA kinase [Chitinivibrionales bacterium]|nr:dephospho-CoA kinase [Chitinivibrionales bacterium]